jgi:dUTP pyrophosphatase
MSSALEDEPNGAVLTGISIRRLIEGSPPLVEGCPDLDRQIQPNGIDLTLESVWKLQGAGQLGTDDAQRMLPRREPLELTDSYYNLATGSYVARLYETVNLPSGLMALGRSRSSLLRSGVALGTAVWDAGYHGRSEVLMIVHNPAGFRVTRGSRILQLVFLRLDRAADAYRGAYQHENLPLTP